MGQDGSDAGESEEVEDDADAEDIDVQVIKAGGEDQDAAEEIEEEDGIGEAEDVYASDHAEEPEEIDDNTEEYKLLLKKWEIADAAAAFEPEAPPQTEEERLAEETKAGETLKQWIEEDEADDKIQQEEEDKNYKEEADEYHA